MEPNDEKSKFSSSAVDSLGILHSVMTFWEHSKLHIEIENPPEFIKFVTNDICRFTLFYFDLEFDRAQKLKPLERDTIELLKEICFSVNNIDFIGQKLQSLVITFIGTYSTSIELPMTVRSTLKYGLDVKGELLKCFSPLMKPAIKLFIEKQVANKVEGLMPIDIMLAKMDKFVRLQLTPDDCTSVRAALYEAFVDAIYETVKNCEGSNPSVKYCKNLEHCFIAVENMMKPIETLMSKVKEIQHFLQYSCLTTEKLIHRYFKDRYNLQQKTNGKPNNRILSVECFFNSEKLIVKIWNAKNLSNETNKTYVKFQIIPVETFSDIQNLKTKVQPKSVVPYYGDCFER